MAENNKDFLTDAKGTIFEQSYARTVRQPVIKSNALDVGMPRKIDAQAQARGHKHDGSIDPIIEGDEIVGFVYECSCGEVAKIMFEYEQKLGRAAS